MDSNEIKIMLITNTGNGGGTYKFLSRGSTVADLLREINTDSATVTVNRAPASANTVLQDNDRVGVAPNKVTGA